MSHIGRNIRKIRSVKNLSQAKFAELFKLARPSVGAYEEGRSEPKIDTVIAIAQHFNLSIDLLLTKDITVNQLYHFDIDKVEEKIEPLVKQVEGIPMLEGKNWLNYILGQRKPDFIDNLPQIVIPKISPKNHLAFVFNRQQAGGSRALNNGDILIGTMVKPSEIAAVQGMLGIVIHNRRAYVLRIVKEEGDQLILSYWEDPSEQVPLSMEKVEEIWAVKQRITQQLDAPNLLERRVLRLEEQIEKLLRD